MEKLNEYKSIFDKNTLKEMSFSISEIQQEIRNKDLYRLEHLLLIFYFPESESNKHWQGEVFSSLSKLARMKQKVKNKFLSYDKYYDNLWNKPYENEDNYKFISDSIFDLIKEGYNIPMNHSKSKNIFIEQSKKFYKDLSVLLSEEKVNKISVYKLLAKYFIKKN